MRSRSWLAQPAAMALAASICLLSAAPAAALITGEFGNKPVQDGGWPTGTLDVANLKSRLGWWEGPPFGGGMYVFLYRESSTADFNAALAAFAKIKAPELLVVFHDGPEESFWLRDHQKPQDQPQPAARVDWTFTVWRPENWHRLYNNPKSYFGSDQEAFRKPVDPPRIDVYLGEGNLVLDDLKLPRGVTVRDERAEAAPFELQEGSFVEGRVYDIASGRIVAGAKLTAYKSVAGEKAFEWHAVGVTTSDDDGAFRLASLDPNAYELRVRADGYAPRTVHLKARGRPTYQAIDVVLAAEAGVSGLVRDLDGQPLEGVTIGVTNVMAIDGRGYTDTERPEAKTDVDGRFRLDRLPAGFAQLSYHKPGYYHTPLGELLALPTEKPIEIAMVRTGKINGKIVDPKDKTASSGANAMLESIKSEWGNWGGGTTTNAEGRFEFDGVPPGKYRLRAIRKSDGKPKDVTVKPGETVEVVLDE